MGRIHSFAFRLSGVVCGGKSLELSGSALSLNTHTVKIVLLKILVRVRKSFKIDADVNVITFGGGN